MRVPLKRHRHIESRRVKRGGSHEWLPHNNGGSDRLGGLLAEEGAKITLLDSAGLRVIARTHERLAERGASLVLASPSLEAMRVLGATGLSDVIQITFADRG